MQIGQILRLGKFPDLIEIMSHDFESHGCAQMLSINSLASSALHKDQESEEFLMVAPPTPHHTLTGIDWLWDWLAKPLERMSAPGRTWTSDLSICHFWSSHRSSDDVTVGGSKCKILNKNKKVTNWTRNGGDVYAKPWAPEAEPELEPSRSRGQSCELGTTEDRFSYKKNFIFLLRKGTLQENRETWYQKIHSEACSAENGINKENSIIPFSLSFC